MSEPEPPDVLARKRRRRRWTWGGILSAAASIATIVSVLSVHSGSSSPTSDAYPANVQANYLNACEENASVSACDCTLTWFEQNVTLAQFQQDEATLEQTGEEPADMQDAVGACS